MKIAMIADTDNGFAVCIYKSNTFQYGMTFNGTSSGDNMIAALRDIRIRVVELVGPHMEVWREDLIRFGFEVR